MFSAKVNINVKVVRISGDEKENVEKEKEDKYKSSKVEKCKE